jgi:hypothetical protein
MNSHVSNIRTSAFFTAREAAWILGVDPSTVCRAIRTGALPTVRRRSCLVVPAHVLIRLLDQPAGTNHPSTIGRNSRGGAP